VIQTAGSDRILVELPGISNLEDATKLIEQTAFLEFVDSGATPLGSDTLICTTNGCPRQTQTDTGSASPTAEAAATPDATSVVTATGTVTGTTAQTTPAATPTPALQTYDAVVSGDDIDGTKVAVVFDQANQPQVQFVLKGDAVRRFADFTSSHVNQYMPIVLDKKVIDSPVIQGAITGGQGVINGLTLADAQRLAKQLRAGALPVSLTLLESRKISATLGQEAVTRSFVAGIIGLGLVVLFMLVYYRLPGALADVALVIYSIVAFAAFKIFHVTLTLAGIAGFILSIGMAVDANVLIFARLKEELRSGKTLAAAVEAGFDHAWPSIRDSNASTLMTCFILYWFGSQFGGASIIKGFALTLAIGVIISLITAITVTRTFLRAVLRTKLAHSKWAFDVDEEPASVTAPVIQP
jgi:preprotein translocase subunit SecD